MAGIGKVAANLTLRNQPTTDAPEEFSSEVHGTKIKFKKFHEFCGDEPNVDAFASVQSNKIQWSQLKPLVERIAAGANIWADNDFLWDSEWVLLCLGAQPCTPHHDERGIELGATAKNWKARDESVSA